MYLADSPSVAIYKTTGELVIIYKTEYSCWVEFPFNISYDLLELGGDKRFEYIGKF